MGIFDRFPYSSTHEMNLDYMLGKATEIAEDMQTVTTGMAQVQAGLSAISEKTEQATQAAASAAQSASSIEGSVTAAEEAAEEAQMHNESAQTWANNALTYKADCQRAATEAAASSSSAAQAATAAAASEDTVAQYAQAANASAQSAANNNDSAHQYANQASASASNATFHSSNAQTAATNANTSATNAETAATNAQTAATRASALKDDCQTLHSMCTKAVDLAGEQAVAAANSAAQAAATKTDVENLVESLPEDFTDLNNTVNQVSAKINDIADNYGTKVTEHHSDEQSTIYDANLTDGYITASGMESSDSSFRKTAKIPVQPGDSVLLVNSGSPTPTYRWICAYNGDTVVPSAGTNSGSTEPYIVPESINGVVLSTYPNHNITGVKVTRTIESTSVKYFPIEQPMGCINWTGVLNTGETKSLLSSNVRHNVAWVLSAHIATVGKVTIGVNKDNTIIPICSVDGTYIYYRSNVSGNISTEEHGLTIADDIQIIVSDSFLVNRLEYIKVSSGGVEHTLSAVSYGVALEGSPCISSEGIALDNCAFSWIPKDINKPIWVFGDSWVSVFDTRWPYYMNQAGFNKSWMLNGFAGEKTQQGLSALKNLLSLRKPEYIVWLYGMNDSDSSSAVSSTWKSAYDELIEICTAYKITPILYTVPTTPTQINTFKNEIVRNSGYRYIDCVSAMGADENGNWINGYQSSDGNHTTAEGAKALYYRILADFPEIASNGL